MLKLIIFRLPQRPPGTLAMRAFPTWRVQRMQRRPRFASFHPGAADTSEDEP
jgi:hypothetical protein